MSVARVRTGHGRVAAASIVSRRNSALLHTCDETHSQQAGLVRTVRGSGASADPQRTVRRRRRDPIFLPAGGTARSRGELVMSLIYGSTKFFIPAGQTWNFTSAINGDPTNGGDYVGPLIAVGVADGLQ